MKKSIIIIFAVFIYHFDGHTQSGQLGLGGGISFPVSAASDVSSFGFYFEANYLFDAADNVKLGLTTGFADVFGKEEKRPLITIDHDDFQYIPIAAAGRLMLSNNIELGADVGYAIAVSDNWDGGFYYRPIFAYNVSNNFQLNMSFSGISDSWITWSTFNLGVLYRS